VAFAFARSWPEYFFDSNGGVGWIFVF